MAPSSSTKSKASQKPSCQVCNAQQSKYRCPACPIRYCSVNCFKSHRESSCTQPTSSSGLNPSSSSSAQSQATDTNGKSNINEHDQSGPQRPLLGDFEENIDTEAVQAPPLRPLTSLAWPPEPDASIFSDALRRDDPKPLRHEELLRIATSPKLRHLLTSPRLTAILRALDTLSTSSARGAALARLLGLDSESLAQPTAHPSSLLFGRDSSPPPLQDLLSAVSGFRTGSRDDTGGRMVSEAGGDVGKGWWLGVGDGRVWVGEEEKQLMRAWAKVVVGAIDGSGKGDEWGSGALTWEV